MGLVQNLFMGVLHLTFVALDILMLMVLLKCICLRWKHPLLKQINESLDPFLSKVLNVFRDLLSRCFSKNFKEPVLSILLLASIWFLRFLIIGLVSP